MTSTANGCREPILPETWNMLERAEAAAGDSSWAERGDYQRLVAARKACGACARLTNCASVQGGRFDSDRLGPYTRWQGNLDSELMVVGQDFADVGKFERVEGWPGSSVRTNVALVDLLAAAGLTVQTPSPNAPDDTLFFTNAVLCLKPDRGLSIRDVRECGARFLRPTIEIVRPRAVATLGRLALIAALHAYDMKFRGKFLERVADGVPIDLPSGPKLFPMCHPNPAVQNRWRSFEAQRGDWCRLGEWLRPARN